MKGSLNLNAIWRTQNILKLKNKVSVSWGNIKQPSTLTSEVTRREVWKLHRKKRPNKINYENPNIQKFVEKR